MRNSERPSDSRQRQRSQLLKFAEYTSLAASVAGTIAATVSRQVLYAAAPLSVSLFLNLINRQRFEQQTQQAIAARATEVSQSLAQLAQLNQQVAQLRSQLTTTLQRIAQLDERVVEAQQNRLDPDALTTQFEAQLAQLSQQLEQELRSIQDQLHEQLQTRANYLTLADLQPIQQAIEALQQHLASVDTQYRQIQDRFVEKSGFETVQQALTELQERIAEFESTPKLPEPPRELLDLNLGIDFGTSFTKVCFRDIGRDRSEVVSFSNEQARLDESLLPTRIGILKDGTLMAGLTASEWATHESQLQTSIEFIKMRLAALDLTQPTQDWRLEHLPQLDSPETVENLCAYYLSRVISRSQSWIRRNKADLVINHEIGWSANVGVPVEYCDSPAIARFEKVLSLAWLLSNEPQTERLTLETLARQMDKLRSQLAQTSDIDCHAIPEIAAEVWSFLNSREAREGLYTCFDVGDGTLDGVSFRYWKDDDDQPMVDFYSGSVQPLGVTAFSQRLAQELKQPPTAVKQSLFSHDPGDCPVPINFRKKIQQLVGQVVYDGYEQHGEHRPGYKKLEFQNGLKVFISGGGGKSQFYCQTIMATHADFNHISIDIPRYISMEIPTPRDLSMSGLNKQEFHRFSVAYGLSIPEWECPNIRLPSEIKEADEGYCSPEKSDSKTPYNNTKDCC